MVEETSQDGKVVEVGFKQSGSIGHAVPTMLKCLSKTTKSPPKAAYANLCSIHGLINGSPST